MNQQRRKELNELVSELEEIENRLESIKNDEEEYRDNLPENLQGSEKYDMSDSACFEMENAIAFLADAISSIEAAQE